jgi:Ni/Fe-hydrogenase subunit HybB-like protein
VGEILVTTGLVAGEIMLYIAIIRVFPILTLEKRHVAYHH